MDEPLSVAAALVISDWARVRFSRETFSTKNKLHRPAIPNFFLVNIRTSVSLFPIFLQVYAVYSNFLLFSPLFFRGCFRFDSFLHLGYINHVTTAGYLWVSLKVP